MDRVKMEYKITYDVRVQEERYNRYRLVKDLGIDEKYITSQIQTKRNYSYIWVKIPKYILKLWESNEDMDALFWWAEKKMKKELIKELDEVNSCKYWNTGFGFPFNIHIDIYSINSKDGRDLLKEYYEVH